MPWLVPAGFTSASPDPLRYDRLPFVRAVGQALTVDRIED